MANINIIMQKRQATNMNDVNKLNKKRDTLFHSHSENISVPARKMVYFAIKRIMDILLSFIAIIVTLPVFIIIALIIKSEDGGPVFYKVSRVGKGGNEFKMYKFRSMYVNADKLEDFLSDEEIEEYRKEFKIKNDPRITKIGKILRKTSLDEIPQIYNIFIGNMSIIGPRPVLDEETRLYGEDRDLLLSVKPGLTGYWQAYARSNCSYADGKRQSMELYYVRNISLMLDIKIFFKTISSVLTGSGAM